MLRHATTQLLLSLLCFTTHVAATEIKFSATKGSRLTEATLGKPAKPVTDERGAPAVVLLHHGGGCTQSQTRAYAESLNAAGYFTLEPCLFYSVAQRERVAASYLPQVFGALRYLAQLPGVDKTRIAIAGGSYGGTLALLSATTWANETHADSSVPRFAAHVPFYPPCFLIQRFVRSGRSLPEIPVDAYKNFSGSPIRIFAGTLDDYEDRDPESCSSMVAVLGEDGKKHISIRMFPGATHGWDHGRTYSFYEAVACKGKGCENTNVFQPDVTLQGIQEMLDFLSSSMRAR